MFGSDKFLKLMFVNFIINNNNSNKIHIVQSLNANILQNLYFVRSFIINIYIIFI